MTEYHFSDDNDEHREVNEQTPLVGSSHSTTQPSSRGPQRLRALSSVASIAGSIHVPKVHSPNTILAIFCAILFTISLANGFNSIPFMRIYEDIICHQFYDGQQSLEDPIDEEMCKDKAIESRLANLLAVSSVLEAAAGCLSAMPWAFIADRFVSYTATVVCPRHTRTYQTFPGSVGGLSLLSV
jgi:hypothetical protein